MHFVLLLKVADLILLSICSYITDIFTEYFETCQITHIFMVILVQKMIDFTVSSTGSVKYSDVRTFMKKDHNAMTKYLLITTYCNKTLTLSPNHLVYARKYTSDEFIPM